MVKREPNFSELFEKEEESNEQDINEVEDNDIENINNEGEDEEEYVVYEDYPSFFEYLQIEAIRFKDKITGFIPRFHQVDEDEDEEYEYEYEYVEDDTNEDDEIEELIYVDDIDNSPIVEKTTKFEPIEDSESSTIEEIDETIENIENQVKLAEKEEIEEIEKTETEAYVDSSNNDIYTKVIKSNIDSRIKYDLDSEVCRYYIKIYRTIICIIVLTVFIVCNFFFTRTCISQQKPKTSIKENEIDYIYVGNNPLSSSVLGSYYINYPTKSIGTIQRYYALDTLNRKYKLNIAKEDIMNSLNKYSYIAKQSKVEKDDFITQAKYDLILEKLIEKNMDKVKIPKDLDAKLKSNEPTYRLSVKAYKCKDVNEGKTLIGKDNVKYNQSFQFSSKDTTFAGLVKMLMVSDYGVVKEPVKLGNNYYVIEYIKKELISDDDTERYKKEQAKLLVFKEMKTIIDKYPVSYRSDKDKKSNKKK